MPKSSTLLGTALAFAGGALAGVVFAPRSGQELRGQLSASARDRSANLVHRLRGLEHRLVALQQHLQASRAAAQTRMRTSATEAMRRYVPDLSPSEWSEGGSVEQDLRHMPRR
ncbi:MAG: hypothetical protein AAGI71_10060 [Bacteroidota bacterium]